MFGNTGKPIGKFIDTFYLNEKMPKKKRKRGNRKKKKMNYLQKGVPVTPIIILFLLNIKNLKNNCKKKEKKSNSLSIFKNIIPG